MGLNSHVILVLETSRRFFSFSVIHLLIMRNELLRQMPWKRMVQIIELKNPHSKGFPYQAHVLHEAPISKVSSSPYLWSPFSKSIELTPSTHLYKAAIRKNTVGFLWNRLKILYIFQPNATYELFADFFSLTQLNNGNNFEGDLIVKGKINLWVGNHIKIPSKNLSIILILPNLPAQVAL